MRHALAIVLLALPAAAFARELYPGQYAQADPGLREWYRSQQVPGGYGKGSPCCSEADGVTAEDAWHGDHYKAAFTILNPVTLEQIDIPWMDVPPEAVLQGPFPSRVGQAIVWWWAEWDDSRRGMLKLDAAGKPIVHIRCFKPGSGV